MRKKILSIVTILVLICLISINLTGCSGNIYERRMRRANYQSIEREQNIPYLFTNEDGTKEIYDVVWRIKGTKFTDDAYYTVTIYRFEDIGHAKKVEKYVQEHPTMLTRAIYRMDDLYFEANSEEALRDVLYIVDITLTDK
ncbi:MAG: hypothetical protein J1F66_03035 [Clostridiales bacterium]|nr:hypothetical protein [Clostridiales bacterium]